MKRSAFKRPASRPHWQRKRKPKAKVGRMKEGPWRNDEHRRRVVACGCLVPRFSVAPSWCWGPIDPHHVTKWRHGGRQPSDALVVPLCRKHHDECQARDVAFEERHGIDFARWIERFSAIGAMAIAAIRERNL